MQIIKYFGPPGTGKTTVLVENVMKEIEGRIPPERIGYVAFTKAAAGEVRRRLLENGYDKEQICYFSTIHSMCYRLLGLARQNVLTDRKLKDFRQVAHYQLTVKRDYNDPFIPIIEGTDAQFRSDITGDDIIYYIYQLARQKLTNPNGITHPPHVDVHYIDYVRRHLPDFVQNYRSFKANHDLVDFTDMLELTLQNQLYPEIDVLFLDEAQDLTPLQWKVFDMWKELARPKRVYIAGDDDQAIYTWAGATPESFLAYPGENRILVNSYRVPRRVNVFARNLIEQNQRRQYKDWRSVTGIEGFIKQNQPIGALLEWLMQTRDKRVFLLTRIRYLLQVIAEQLYRLGIPYVNLRGPSPMASTKRYAFATVKKELHVYSPGELEKLVQYVPSRGYWERGAKTKIREELKKTENRERNYSLDDIAALGGTEQLITALQKHDTTILGGYGFTEDDRHYYSRVYDRFGREAFDQYPHVTLATIHAVKGREADIVALWPDTTQKIWENSLHLDGREAERRVWYVGATRAREGLVLMRPLRARFTYSFGGVNT